MKIFYSLIVFFALIFQSHLIGEGVEILPLEVISYEDFIQNDANAIQVLQNALYKKGIVGIRGIPTYAEKVENFVKTYQAFLLLPNEAKQAVAPNHDLGETFLGYEEGKERFKGPDGRWLIDDLKISYYALIPENQKNKWPLDCDLQTAFQDLGAIMVDTAQLVMKKIHLIGPSTGIFIEDTPKVGRMLYYQKKGDTHRENPFWCGAHFDHAMFTALTPATYFTRGNCTSEPDEAGLFVKVGEKYKKVLADPEVLMFQVGEFGQLVTDDAIRATKHRVHKAHSKEVERYAMAVFFNPPMETIIHSYSELTQDDRYSGQAGDPCSYEHWNDETFKRFIVK